MSEHSSGPMSEQRTRILEALARGDGQMLDGFDLGHTAEMMYGKQADAVALLIGQETHRFAMELAENFAHDARLTKGLPGDRHTRRALTMAADELRLRARLKSPRRLARSPASPDKSA